jgi:hypothetical protein
MQYKVQWNLSIMVTPRLRKSAAVIERRQILETKKEEAALHTDHYIWVQL